MAIACRIIGMRKVRAVQSRITANGRKVVSEGNSTFRDWNIAKAAMGERLFKVDERVMKAQK